MHLDMCVGDRFGRAFLALFTGTRIAAQYPSVSCVYFFSDTANAKDKNVQFPYL